MEREAEMRIKAVAMTITLIILAMVFMPKPVLASPDTYYLEDNNVLTTEKPSDPFSSIEILANKIEKIIWRSGTIGDKTIEAGTYTFVFWMGRAKADAVYVTFEFGYYRGNVYHKITGGSKSFNIPENQIVRCELTGSGSRTDIPAGSQLYINVTIDNPPGGKAYFYYSGSTYYTHIETPSITVPEFPFGVFLLPLMLLTVYLILRRRTPMMLEGSA